MNSKVEPNLKEIPGALASAFDKLQYEHAKLYEAFRLRGEEIQDLESMINSHQDAFGVIEVAIRRALK